MVQNLNPASGFKLSKMKFRARSRFRALFSLALISGPGSPVAVFAAVHNQAFPPVDFAQLGVTRKAEACPIAPGKVNALEGLFNWVASALRQDPRRLC